jgi:hypothetical protein
MKCLYYLAPTLKSTHDISDDLHEVGINDYFLHVVSRDESGLKQQHIHSSNYLETLDLIRDGLIGAVVGFLAGLLGVWALQYFQPLGPNVHVPSFVYYLIVAVATLFGAWEGGLIGVASENKKLARFHDDLEAGKYLILIYALKAKEDTVRAMMRERHPEAELVAVDSHYINPFSSIKRGADGDRPGPRAQQKV